MGRKKGKGKIICDCCDRLLAKRTVREHLFILQKSYEFQKRLMSLEESPSPSDNHAAVGVRRMMIRRCHPPGPRSITTQSGTTTRTMQRHFIWGKKVIQVSHFDLLTQVEAEPPASPPAPAFATEKTPEFVCMAEYVQSHGEMLIILGNSS
jgi:hypothetical protein